MKITLRKGPNVLGVRIGVEIDTKELPTPEAEELRRLVELAKLEATAAEKKSAAAPDQREVTISIDTSDRHLEAKFMEGEAPPQLAPLLDYLDRRARIIPNK